MWKNYSFSQRNKTTKRAVGLEVGGNKAGWVQKKLKKARR